MDLQQADTNKDTLNGNKDNRLTNFLLGLVVALTLCAVALEYSSHNVPPSADKDALDDMPQDIESVPIVSHAAMLAATTTAKPSTLVNTRPDAKKATDKLNIIDDLTSKKLDNTPSNGEKEEGAAGNATVSAVGAVTSGKDDAHTDALSPIPPDIAQKNMSLRVVEELPDFPGGMVEFMKWLTRNLRYPVQAKNQKIEGTVIVSFIVNKNGTTAALKIVKSADPLLDREALRALGTMPQWKPGTENGKPCRTMICIPVVFKL